MLCVRARNLCEACKWSSTCPQRMHMLGFTVKVLMALSGASARLEGVNRPDLLPKEDTPLIDVAGFLTPGEVCLSLEKQQSVQCLSFVMAHKGGSRGL